MEVIGIIPARYASKRFAGKALVDVMGKPMIVRVYEQATQALDQVWVATDDKRIAQVLQTHGIDYVMTDPDLSSGTARCAQAMQKLQSTADYVLNIQGDEPFLAPQQIEDLLKVIQNTATKHPIEIATLVKRIEDVRWLDNVHVVKVVLNAYQEALYFSRSVIPHPRLMPLDQALKQWTYYKHVGVYLYSNTVLQALVDLPPTALEKIEALEQLRWLAHGYRIQTVETQWQSFNIDTPEDLKHAIQQQAAKEQ